jgi:hypothetical protein
MRQAGPKPSHPVGPDLKGRARDEERGIMATKKDMKRWIKSARVALRAYEATPGTDEWSNVDNLTDLLVNLYHLASHMGIDVPRLMAKVEGHYNAEGEER